MLFIYVTYFVAFYHRHAFGGSSQTNVLVSIRLVVCFCVSALLLLIFAPYPAMLFDAYRDEKRREDAKQQKPDRKVIA